MGKKPNLNEFFGAKAKNYDEDKNLKKLQIKTTKRSLELLNQNKMFPKNAEILDLGCGSGWSMEVLKDYGYENIVGIDISDDMLILAKNKGFKVFKADLKQKLPFSNKKFHAIISISVINFIIEEITDLSNYKLICNNTAKEIYRVLKLNGRAVIQFFKDPKFELTMSKAFKNAGFSGYIVIDDKNLRKEKRFFVLDKLTIKESEMSDSSKKIIRHKKFSRKIEDFTCINCGTFVKGTGYTDHCPNCLYSVHTDVNPGDRASKCHGIMVPIRTEYLNDQFIIYYKCLRCNYEHKVKAHKLDNKELLIKLLP
ncbi:MAG: RNHCP domain-containing protein, partial [Candidatus Helarchaeota archaeon]